MKLLINLPIQLLGHRPRIYHASTNLAVRGPTSTNLRARSPTLRTFLPVVQHTWSNNQEPPRSQQPLSVSMEHTNLTARIFTREHHNMNLPAHIITFSSSVMNLPAHDTIKHLLVQVHISTHQSEIKESTLRYTRYILKLVLWIPMLQRTSPLMVQLYEPPYS